MELKGRRSDMEFKGDLQGLRRLLRVSVCVIISANGGII